MVSIRRRKHLTMGHGPRNMTYLVQLSRFNANTSHISFDPSKDIRLLSANSTRSTNVSPKKEINSVEACPGSSNVSGCRSSKEKQYPLSSVTWLEIKERKRQRKKDPQYEKPCMMRGVYLKNMKWQAAIKVDKKQIHLGTVGSQEEAARLYDRAAFMCGRETNFELSDEEKKELRSFDWESFLAMTRNAITTKSTTCDARSSRGSAVAEPFAAAVFQAQSVEHELAPLE